MSLKIIILPIHPPYCCMKNFVLVSHLEDLDSESKYLAHKAKDAANHAYAPYSKFLVGACIKFKNGTFSSGHNIE